MSYTKTVWSNGVTALSDTNMNHIEQGIYDAHSGISELSEDLSGDISELRGDVQELAASISFKSISLGEQVQIGGFQTVDLEFEITEEDYNKTILLQRFAHSGVAATADLVVLDANKAVVVSTPERYIYKVSVRNLNQQPVTLATSVTNVSLLLLTLQGE